MRVVFCTCPQDKALAITEVILKERLAACVNVIDRVISQYHWQGKIEKEVEALLIIKTRSSLMNELITQIKSIHPYAVPEIISFEIAEGNPDYLKWIAESTVRTEA